MKRLIPALLLIVVLLLSGCKGGVTGGAVVCNKPYILVGTECCLDQNDNQICDKDELENLNAEPVDAPKEEVIEEPAPEPQEIVEEPIEEPQPEPVTALNEFFMKVGDSVEFDKKKITLISLENIPRLKAVFDVDGGEREVFGTKNIELIKGLKIMIYKYYNLENAIVAKFEKLELGIDEYLLNPREDVTIQGRTLHLEDVQESGAVLIRIFGKDIETEILRIPEGRTEPFAGLKITNIEGFPQGFKLDEYAMVKIET